MNQSIQIEFDSVGTSFRLLEAVSSGADAVARQIAVNLMSPRNDPIFEDRGTALSWSSFSSAVMTAAGVGSQASFAAVHSLYFVAEYNKAAPADRPADVILTPVSAGRRTDFLLTLKTQDGRTLSYPEPS